LVLVEAQEAFDREAARWDRAIEAAGMTGFPQDYFRALIAVQRLAGAENRSEAVQLVHAVWDADSLMSDPPTLHPGTLNALLRLLAMLYPPRDRAYWGGVSDTLLVSLLEALEGLGEEFLPHILLSERLTDRQRFSCLRQLSLTFPAAHPHRLERAAKAVQARPDLLHRGAVQVMPEMPPDTRRRWQASALANLEDGSQQPETAVPSVDRDPAPVAAAVSAPPVALAVPPLPDYSPTVPLPATPPPPWPSERPSKARPAAKPRAGLGPVRDYLGFDVHGWRRVLAGVALLTVAGLILLAAS
jgi:hypothetical protein